LGDPLKGKLAAVLQTSALGGPTLSTGKGGGVDISYAPVKYSFFFNDKRGERERESLDDVFSLEYLTKKIVGSLPTYLT
jgi:hypothetical protein